VRPCRSRAFSSACRASGGTPSFATTVSATASPELRPARAAARARRAWEQPTVHHDSHGEGPGLHQNLAAAETVGPSRERWPRLTGVEVTHRGGFAYVTGTLSDGEQLPLCRLRYGGSASIWGFSIYRASHDDYQPSVLHTGMTPGSPEEALHTACGLYLNDPSAWT
jgi:hypothetical protein